MKLSQQQLEAHLLGAANILRGRTAGQDYKNYILSLMFYKRLCDQWEHEANDTISELELQQGRPFTDKQRAVIRARNEHRFKIPPGAHWGDVKAAATEIGAVLTRAMRAVADSNEELRGVFTVDWNQPAPDGSGRPLIPNEVVHALVQHFDEHNLSNANVPQDVLGRAYEYLIKHFADDAGARAGEFFTPPEVVDVLVRMLRPTPGDTIYDPTSGSGGMLVHSADYLREHGHHATTARYYAQEMNWSNAAIGKINSVLHGLEADIKAGTSTITDPQFLDAEGRVQRFSLVLANFPFSDEMWWLRPEQQTDDKKKKEKLKKEVFGKDGYKDPYSRFGRGTPFPAPPANYGDYAFILHILASLSATGRAAIVCPQGILFRGQPAVDPSQEGEEGRKRKADDEYLIRRALLEARVIDAVVALPPNVFYGAGVPACLFILRRDRPAARRNRVLFIYAARHYRELPAQNELRPQDVMRILVHYHAYGKRTQVAKLIDEQQSRLDKQIDNRERDEVGVIGAEYQQYAERQQDLPKMLAWARTAVDSADSTRERTRAAKALGKLEDEAEKVEQKLSERDRRLMAARMRADEDRIALRDVQHELLRLYRDSKALAKHARLVPMDEIEDNEFNLNVPRYVDTFEPEPYVPLTDALALVPDARTEVAAAERRLSRLLRTLRYAD
jgi:type I restriction enzyme M protein